LALAAGLNRAVLSLTMAQSLEKAVERVAMPMASAGISAVTIASNHDGVLHGLIAWDGAASGELQMAKDGLFDGVTVNFTESLDAVGDTWQHLDKDTFGDSKLFIQPPRDPDGVYATAVSLDGDKRIIVLISSERSLNEHSVIGQAALDLCRRLAKKI
jgi:hypothetical protein